MKNPAALPNRRRVPGRRAAHGLSLVELMVAIAVGLVLVTGLATLFANSSQSGNELEKSIRQMENGRYAVELMSEDMSVAGYYGEISSDGMTYSNPDVCATANASLGWNNATSTIPVFVTGLGGTETAALSCLPNQKPGTVALVLRRLETVSVAPAAASTTSAWLQSSRCATDPNATRFIISSTASDFTLRDLNCTDPAHVRRYVSRIYYVASCNECGSDSIPTLKRAEIQPTQVAVTPLAEGIDEIAFEFGFDTNGDGMPDVFRTSLSGTAGAADNDWGNVVATRLYVMSRSTETSAGFTDGKTYSLGMAGSRGPFADSYKRRIYAVTARLNNPAGTREAP